MDKFKLSRRDAVIIMVTCCVLCLLFSAAWLFASRINEGEYFISTEYRGWSAPPAVGAVNINTATAEELQWIPGIGQGLANTIVNYRESNGPFRSISDIMEVRGITEDVFIAIMGFITVENE